MRNKNQQPPRTELLAIDWGTSSLRGALIAADGTVLGERAFPRGILSVRKNEFPHVFDYCFSDWIKQRAAHALISGMAGSQQGWIEAPYCACPAGFDELAASVVKVSDSSLTLPVAIVPGLSCEHPGAGGGALARPDVMRGEEVQIFGAMRRMGRTSGIFVLPGTHSKWATVADGRVTGFSTYMTGEFYALLSQHSLLARTLDKDAPFDEAGFVQGLMQAHQGGGLLHNAFSARSLALFARMQPGPLASYLSGLLIGEELHARTLTPGVPVTLIGSDTLTQRYALALTLRGVSSDTLGAEATWAGLHAVAQSIEDTHPSRNNR